MQVAGLRRFMIVVCTSFVATSALSAVAHSLAAEILLRGVQGVLGGAFGVAAFGMVFRVFPVRNRALGITLLTFAQTVPSSLGAVLAGWITAGPGWPAVYLVEIGLALVILAEVLASAEQQPFDPKPLAVLDWLGWAVLTPALGLLLVGISQGNRRFWFESPLVGWSLAGGLALLVLFLVLEAGRTDGLVDFRLLGRRSFGAAALLNLVFRFGLLDGGYVLPGFLGQVQGYRPLQVGGLLAVTTCVQALMFAGTYALVRLAPPRAPALLGLALFGAAGLVDGFSTGLSAADQFTLTQALLGAAAPLFVVPLLLIGTRDVKPTEGASASTFFNGGRSLATQLGTAGLATLIRYREGFHSASLTERISQGLLQDNGRLDALAAAFARTDPDLARQAAKATATLAAQVRGQAYVLAYNDAFLVIGAVLGTGALLTFLLPPAPRAAS